MSSKTLATLTNKLSVNQTHEVTRWWEALPAARRRAVETLLEQQAASTPVQVVGRFVDARQRYEDVEAPLCIDFYEYLVNHELTLDDGPTYHVCSAHPEARAVLAIGDVPAGFRCPFARTECPMRVILDREPGRDLRLHLKVR